MKGRKLWFVFICLVMSLGLTGQALAASVAKKRLEIKKAFMLRNIDDLGRTSEFAQEVNEALAEQLEAVKLARSGNLLRESQAQSDKLQRYSEWLLSLTAEFEQAFNDFAPLQKDEPIVLGRYSALVEESQRQIDAFGSWLQKLDSERPAIAARVERLNNAVIEKRVLIDVADLELARELWPEYRDRFRDYGKPVYRDLTDDELNRLRSELLELQNQQSLYDGMSSFISTEQQWWLFKVDEFRAISEQAAAFDDVNPDKLDEALNNTIRTYEAALPAMARSLAALDEANQGLPHGGTFDFLGYRKELQNYYYIAMSRYERHISWLEGEAGSLKIDRVELARERGREAKASHEKAPVAAH